MVHELCLQFGLCSVLNLSRSVGERRGAPDKFNKFNKLHSAEVPPHGPQGAYFLFGCPACECKAEPCVGAFFCAFAWNVVLGCVGAGVSYGFLRYCKTSNKCVASKTVRI